MVTNTSVTVAQGAGWIYIFLFVVSMDFTTIYPPIMEDAFRNLLFGQLRGRWLTPYFPSPEFGIPGLPWKELEWIQFLLLPQKRHPCRSTMEYCFRFDTFGGLWFWMHFVQLSNKGPGFAANVQPVEKKNNYNPSGSGSTAIQLLMKSHPIAVSSDHRGVFGALTGPMRAPIWPCPHESEWAVQQQNLSPRSFMQMVLIRLSEIISSAAGGSEHKWEDVQERKEERKADRHSQPVWEDVRHATGISMWLQVGRENGGSWGRQRPLTVVRRSK